MDESVAQLESLYRELGPSVWAFLRRRTPDAGDADELLQETFLAALRNRAGLDAALSKRAWLIGIARNLHRQFLRRRKRDRVIVPMADEPSAHESPFEDPRLQDMRRAIARLPDTHREVLDMRLADDLSYAQIAEATGVPVGTVRSRIHHAVRRLREWAAETHAAVDSDDASPSRGPANASAEGQRP